MCFEVQHKLPAELEHAARARSRIARAAVSLDCDWISQWQERALFGKCIHLPCSDLALAEDVEEPPERQEKRTPVTMEPVFYHNYPEMVYHDLLKAYKIRYVLDFTPGDGSCALASYKPGIVYLGAAFSETHKASLQTRLRAEVVQSMVTERDPIYNSKLAAALCSKEALPSL